jgi:DNA repair protein RadA/Sms
VCVFGEIGLGGEIRHAQQADLRLTEAARLGFREVIAPPLSVRLPDGCVHIPVKRLDEALEHLV